MGERLWVATRKGLFGLERRARGGDGWSITNSSFVGDNVSLVLADRRDGYVYAALNLGHFGVKLHRSADGGKTWQECAAPVYPPRPEGEPDWICPVRNTSIPWNLELIWELHPGGADQPGVLWCGTVPGGVFRSSDRGDSWELVRPLWDRPERRQWFGGGMDHPGVHSISVDPRDSRCVTVGVSCGGVWVTEDGGESWEPRTQGMRAAYMPPERQFDPVIQDPHRVVQCRSAPEVLWAQHHNGIFHSGDGGRKWEEITAAKPSAFGFAVVVHPADPQTAWFVPALSDQQRVPVEARVVVSRTRDGGRSFDVLTDGLPQEHAYDITFRHALDVDERGERLAFGSTTGSLWISEDQGERWALAAGHLPPVYCVRFA